MLGPAAGRHENVSALAYQALYFIIIIIILVWYQTAADLPERTEQSEF